MFVYRGGSVEIAGKESTSLPVTMSLGNSLFSVGNNPFSNGDQVQLTKQSDILSGSYLPSGSNEGEVYFISGSSGNSFFLTKENGNKDSKLIIHDTGSGVIYIDSDSNWNSITSVAGSSNGTYLLDVQDGIYMDYRLNNVNALGGESSYSYIRRHFVIGKTAPPDPITNLSISYDDENLKVDLNWSNPSDLDLDTITVERKVENESEFSEIGSLPKSRTKYIDYDIIPSPNDLIYDYRIQTFDTTNNSSSYVTGSTVVDGIDLVENFNVFTSSLSVFSFNLSWDDTGQDEDILVEYWDTPAKREVNSIWYSEDNNNNTIDTQYSGSYFVQARRIRKGVFSHYVSSSVEVPGYLPPDPVTNVSASYDFSNNVVSLYWSNPTTRGYKETIVSKIITHDPDTLNRDVTRQPGVIQSHTDTFVIPDSSVTYEFTPINSENETGSTTSYNINIPVLDRLENLTVETSSLPYTQITKWDRDTEYNDYVRLYYSEPSSGIFSLVLIPMSQESHVQSFESRGPNLVLGSRVRKIKDPLTGDIYTVYSAPTQVESEVIGYPIPSPVTNVSASYDFSKNTIQLDWKNPSSRGYVGTHVSKSITHGGSTINRTVTSQPDVIETYTDTFVFPTSSVTYTFKPFNLDGVEGNPTDYVIDVPDLEPLQNFAIDSASVKYSLNTSWDVDTTYGDYAYLYYSDPLTGTYTGPFVRLSEESRSIAFSHTGSNKVNAYRVRIVKDPQTLSQTTFYSPKDENFTEVLGYGELKAPLTSSIATSGQYFILSWDEAEDQHTAEKYKVYIHSGSNFAGATLLAETPNPSYNYLSPTPYADRYFWIQKVSAETGDVSPVSEPMHDRCEYDFINTKRIDVSNTTVFNPPTGSFGQLYGRDISDGRYFSFHISGSTDYDLIVTAPKWSMKIENNSSNTVQIGCDAKIIKGDGTESGTSLGYILVPPYSTKTENPFSPSLIEPDLPTGSYEVRVYMTGRVYYSWQYAPPFTPVQFVTASVLQGWLDCNYYKVPENGYTLHELPSE